MEKKHILCNKQLVLSVMVFLCMGRTTAGAQAPVESSMSSGCDCAVSSSACDCSTGSSKCDCAVCSSESTCDGSHKKAWEFGVGLNGLQMTRFNVTGFRVNPQGGYNIDTDKRDLFFGGHVYVARELNRFFYLDFQGLFDYSSDPVYNGRTARWVGMAGLGLQWRLGEYFHSSCIDPFLRVGVNYMHKNFKIDYTGMQGLDLEQMRWNFSNDYDKEGSDKKNLIPLSAGAGVNMWLSNRVGIGLQAEYLVMPYKQVANSWNGTLRLMWRFGGKPRKQSQVRYVEKIVERVVEKPVVTEKIVQVPSQEKALYELFENVYFAFDKADITGASLATVDKIARIMLSDTQKRYLITGCTDARGSQQYNMMLSKKRADAVVEALVQRGVPAERLKSRGVGKKISYAAGSCSTDIRRGDRKILVEVITNMDYWNYIP